MLERCSWIQVVALVLFVLFGRAMAQSSSLPTESSSLFTGSGRCAICHVSNETALRDSRGVDVAPVTHWAPTMMANAARDPLWQAKVESEVAEFPALKEVIENKCTTCHMPMGRTQAVFDGATGYSLEEGNASQLAMDGVSCTVCHQIQPDNLGTDESFSGGFSIDDSRTIFGPYLETLTGPMQNTINYLPTFGAHVQGSELCATCHTLFTPFVDDQGEVAGEFPEQVAYLEWQNSDHGREGRECQDCHMPRLDEPITITKIPPTAEARSPFWQHFFVGGNAFMLQILRDNGAEIGTVASPAQFDSAIVRTRQQLREQTVRMAVEAAVERDRLVLDVEVENLAGHKFPTGIPIRRAWLHVRVTDAAGEEVFESGGYDAEGRLHHETGAMEPHRDTVDVETQTQIYEGVMIDVNGEPTHALLRAAGFSKDNRIPPSGFVSSASRYDDMAIRGGAVDDSDFNRDGDTEGTGKDRVVYRIDTEGRSGKLAVAVELLYQSVKPQFADDLFGHDTQAVSRFAGYYNSAERTPEWVQTAALEVELPEVTYSPFDYNLDEKVDFDDFFLFADRFGSREGESDWNAAYDADDSGAVDFDDFFRFADAFGKN